MNGETTGKLDESAVEAIAARANAVRVSFAPYNRPDEVDRLLEGLTAITSGRTILRYAQDPRTGDYDPVDWSPDWKGTFSIRR
jgi:hypothetical protein